MTATIVLLFESRKFQLKVVLVSSVISSKKNHKPLSTWKVLQLPQLFSSLALPRSIFRTWIATDFLLFEEFPIAISHADRKKEDFFLTIEAWNKHYQFQKLESFSVHHFLWVFLASALIHFEDLNNQSHGIKLQLTIFNMKILRLKFTGLMKSYSQTHKNKLNDSENFLKSVEVIKNLSKIVNVENILLSNELLSQQNQSLYQNGLSLLV